MKRKKIEQIPWLITKSKSKNIIAKAAVVEVEGEKTLILDTITSEGPFIRVCVTKDQFANYGKKDQVWNTRIIDNAFLYNRPCTFKIDKKSEEIIYKWLNDNSKYRAYQSSWYNNLDSIERFIKDKKSREAEKRHQQAIDKRMKSVPKEPRGFKKFVNQVIDTSMMFIQPFGGKKETTGICSKCGKEHVFQKGEVKAGGFIKCPGCKTKTLVKRVSEKSVYGFHLEAILLQKTVEGFVERHYHVEKQISKGNEEAWYIEKVRVFLIQGRRFTYFHKRGLGGDWWDDKNIPGMSNITYGPGWVYSKNLSKVLKDSTYQYSSLELLTAETKIDPLGYFKKYDSMPELEIMAKIGMKKLVLEISPYDVKNESSKNPWERIGITKEQANRLREVNGGRCTLHVLQNEKRYHHGKELLFIEQNQLSSNQIQVFEEVTTITKIQNYIKKDIGYQKESERLSHYFDYLSLAKTLDYDLHRDSIIFPKDLRKAHDEAVLRNDEIKAESNCKYANETYPLIKKMSREINRSFGFSDEKLFIRAPRDAAEIVKEGQVLHHCVGGNLREDYCYIAKMTRKENAILLLRKVEEKDKPFYTIEIRFGQDGPYIVQYYGLNDKKPEFELVEPFIKRFEEKLKGETHEKYNAAG